MQRYDIEREIEELKDYIYKTMASAQTIEGDYVE